MKGHRKSQTCGKGLSMFSLELKLNDDSQLFTMFMIMTINIIVCVCGWSRHNYIIHICYIEILLAVFFYYYLCSHHNNIKKYNF